MIAQRKNSAGQALVLVLLFLAVVLTLVLYILSRTVTGVAISTGNEDSVRAFSAAEAGIENALVIGTGGTNVAIGSSTYSSSVTDVAEGSDNFIYPISLLSGESATIWFVAHKDDGTLGCDATHPCFTGRYVKVCWGNPTSSLPSNVSPAVEFSVFYESTPGVASTVKIARAALDPFAGRTPANNFSTDGIGSCTIAGESYQFGKTVDLLGLGIPAGSYGVENGLQFGRLRIFYNNTAQKVGFDLSAGAALPSQGFQIDSTGKAGVSNRRLSVFQSWPEPPPVFDNAIYSAAGLTK